MSKSLNARCIRRWEVEFKSVCDSKFSPWECALTTADCMVERLAEDNARSDFQGNSFGWSPEFADWYRERREQYRNEALSYLNEDATIAEIDEEIQNELEAWND